MRRDIILIAEVKIADRWLLAFPMGKNRHWVNPATNGVCIEFDKYYQNNIDLTIYNMLGQMIVQEYRNLSNDKKAFLDIPPGTNKILILKVAIGDEVLERKIVRKQLVQ